MTEALRFFGYPIEYVYGWYQLKVDDVVVSVWKDKALGDWLATLSDGSVTEAETLFYGDAQAALTALEGLVRDRYSKTDRIRHMFEERAAARFIEGDSAIGESCPEGPITFHGLEFEAIKPGVFDLKLGERRLRLRVVHSHRGLRWLVRLDSLKGDQPSYADMGRTPSLALYRLYRSMGRPFLGLLLAEGEVRLRGETLEAFRDFINGL